MQQLSLISDSQIARRSDPEGSHEAARRVTDSGTRASQQRAVLSCVQRSPGRTSRELAKAYGLDRYMVGRRLPELREVGKVRNDEKRECRISGVTCETWWPR